MNKIERQKCILALLDEETQIVPKSLEERLQVSHMSINRDLIELEDKGLLVRKYGYICKSASLGDVFSFNRRKAKMEKAKKAICRKAAKNIKNGDTIFIDCGTTLHYLPAALKDRQRLRVITNSLPVAFDLMCYPNIKTTLLGGEILSGRQATYGPSSQAMLNNMRADKAFIGADGISLANGLSFYDENEGLITINMAKRSKTVYLACDSSKFETDSHTCFEPISLIDYIITDSEIPASVAKKYAECKYNIILREIEK